VSMNAAMLAMTLVDTACFASLLLLSLVLPLMLSLSAAHVAVRRSCLNTVWLGQTLLSVAGLAVLISAFGAPFALAFGVLSCGACAVRLRRQLR